MASQAATIDRLAHAAERARREAELLRAQVHRPEGRVLRPSYSPRATQVFSKVEYAALVHRFRETLEAILPVGARVLVVSKGDDALLEIEGRVAAHFPQHASGRYAGHYPQTGTAAVEALTHLLDNGFEYIAFPGSSLWWLEHYSELQHFLEKHGYLIDWSYDTCAVYGLTAREILSALRDVGRVLSARTRQVQALLDEAEIVSPPPSSLSSRDAYEQLLKTRLDVFLASGSALSFPKATRPRASVVIPVHNKAFYTFQVPVLSPRALGHRRAHRGK